MLIPTNPDLLVDSTIAWLYLVTNSLRGLTYIPQIVVVWRSRDGARSLSLLTWGAWLVAHVAAVLYGLVLHDVFFTTISLVNCTGCGIVVGLTAKRRRESNLAAGVGGASAPGTASRWNVAASAYLARWGCGPRWLAADARPAHMPAADPIRYAAVTERRTPGLVT